MILDVMVNSKTSYQLNSLVKTLQYLPFFKFEEELNVEGSLVEKILKIEGNVSSEEVFNGLVYFVSK
jgi:hypothetical protein